MQLKMTGLLRMAFVEYSLSLEKEIFLFLNKLEYYECKIKQFKNTQEAHSICAILVQCSAHTDPAVCSLTFPFWHSLSTALLTLMPDVTTF